METTDIIRKVRKIEIKTKSLTQNIFAGEYHSAFKGRGMAFSEVREYQVGDDVRNIDWNVTARFNHPFVKVFEEERELTVILLIDVSNSGSFGTKSQFKQELITEIAAVLAFSAINNNDKIGVILFSDSIEKFIPPQKGRKHILRIIRELLDCNPKGKGTNISEALRYLTNAIKKRSTVFVISDFIDSDFSKALRIARYKHDLVALRVYDRHEAELPNIGFVKFMDTESQKVEWVDTSSAKVRKHFRAKWKQYDQNLNETFRKTGVDWASVTTGHDYVKPLIQLFKRR